MPKIRPQDSTIRIRFRTSATSAFYCPHLTLRVDYRLHKGHAFLRDNTELNYIKSVVLSFVEWLSSFRGLQCVKGK